MSSICWHKFSYNACHYQTSMFMDVANHAVSSLDAIKK